MYYLKVAEAEKPIEKQLKINMDLGLVVHCLDQKKMMLQDKLKSQKFKGYNEKKNIDFSVLE